MPTNLTGTKIKDTYSQLLHVDGGPSASEKAVLSGTGVATALKVGTSSVSVDNIRLDGNAISATNENGDITLNPNGTGSVAVDNLRISGNTISAADTDGDIILSAPGSGSVVIDKADITGGSITNVVFTGSFSGITSIESDKFSTKNGTDGVSIEDTNVFAEGESENIDLNITAKGTGEVNITNVDIISGKVPFNTVTNRAYASFYDAGTTDQVGSTTARTAVKWATASVAGAGIAVFDNSRITITAAGTYRFNASLQFFNSTNTVRTVDIWFAKNGDAIPNSGARITVPANNAGGTNLVAYEIFETIAANDYIEMFWHPSDVSAVLHYIAPVAFVSGVTPEIPAVPPAIVVVERVA